MRFRTMLLTALLLLPFAVPGFAQDRDRDRDRYRPRDEGPPPAARPMPARVLWVYGEQDQYLFWRMADGRWVQYAADGRFYFDEVRRTREYVELYDSSRRVGARLYDDGLWSRPAESDRFAFTLRGHWAF